MNKLLFGIIILYTFDIQNVKSNSIDRRSAQIDSLKSVVFRLSDDDTLKVKAYLEWSGLVYYSAGDSERVINELVLSLCKENLEKRKSAPIERFYQHAKSVALINLGLYYKKLGTLKKADDYYKQAYDIALKLNDKEGIANVLNNMAIIMQDAGNIVVALEYYEKAFKMVEEVDSKIGMATLLNNIGHAYMVQYENDKALTYFEESLRISKEIKDEPGIVDLFINIASIHESQGFPDFALAYYRQGLSKSRAIGYKKSEAEILNKIGNIMLIKEKMEQALSHFQSSLDLSKEIKNKLLIANSLNSLAAYYIQKNELKKSKQFALNAYQISIELSFPVQIRDAAKSLYIYFKRNGLDKKALHYHEIYTTMRDSIVNESNFKNVIKNQFQHAYRSRVVMDSLKNIDGQKIQDARIALQAVQLGKVKLQRYTLIVILILTLVLLAVSYRALRSKQKRNLLIEKQQQQLAKNHEQLKNTHNELTDSILYAKRLQNAILPSALVKRYFPNSFVLSLPKEQVSGDFYWMKTLPSRNSTKPKVLYAVADCTGHGVPGAMVSVMCINALNSAVKDFGKMNPSDILAKTTDILIESFEKSDNVVRDGMDIALCCFDMNSNEIEYAGAFNPLWIVRDFDKLSEEQRSYSELCINNDTKMALIEIKANRQPVGKYPKRQVFVSTKLKLELGDIVYMFSDGFVDQFGGPKGRKFGRKRLKEFLLDFPIDTINNYGDALESLHQEWRGDVEQTDDICIMGVQVLANNL